MAIPKTLELSATYQSFAGTDIVASITLPGYGSFVIGELQTVSYSIHRDKYPVRALGFTNAKGYTNGPRTVAGNLIFTVFDRHIVYQILKKIGKGSHRILTDEMPPFDITVSFGSEYGHKAKLVIFGVSVVDEGQVMSINDLITENTMSFVARDIDLMRPIEMAGSSKPSKTKQGALSEGSMQMTADTRVPVDSWDVAEYEEEIGGIVGALKGTDGQTLVETKVKIMSPNHASLTYTNKNGEFCFENIPTGEYKLTVNKDGCIPYERLLNVLANRVTELGVIELKRETYTVVTALQRAGSARRTSYSDSLIEFAIRAEGHGGFPVAGVPIEWQYRIENDIFRKFYGLNYQTFVNSRTDREGYSKVALIIPKAFPDGSALQVGDVISIRANIKGDTHIAPQYFRLTIEEGETIGQFR